jgi:hypothetical protein
MNISIIDYFNPFSSRFNSWNDFQELSKRKKTFIIVMIALAVCLTLTIGTVVTFRLLIGRLKRMDSSASFNSSTQRTQQVSDRAFAPIPPVPSSNSGVTSSHSNEQYEMVSDHIAKEFLNHEDQIKLDSEVTSLRIQDLYQQCQEMEVYGILSAAEKQALAGFVNRVDQRKIRRDNEVFTDENSKEQSYQLLSLSLKHTLHLLQNEPIEKWRHVINLFASTDGECFIAHADAAYQAYLFLIEKANLIERIESLENQLLKLLAHLRVRVVRELATKFGRRETHTIIGLLKRLGQKKNLPAQELTHVSDKQDDLRLVPEDELCKAFDQAYTLGLIVDWIYLAVNGLDPFNKQMISQSYVVNLLASSITEQNERSEAMAYLYGAPSYDEFILDSARYSCLTKDTVLKLLAHFNIVKLKSPNSQESSQKKTLGMNLKQASVETSVYHNIHFLDYTTQVKQSNNYLVLSDGYAYDLDENSVDCQWLLQLINENSPWVSPWSRSPLSEEDRKQFLSKIPPSILLKSSQKSSSVIPVDDSQNMEEAARILLNFAEVLCSERDVFTSSEAMWGDIISIIDHPIIRLPIHLSDPRAANMRNIQDLINALQTGQNAHLIAVLLWKSISQHFPNLTAHWFSEDINSAAYHHGIGL